MCCDIDVIELLGFRNKFILAGILMFGMVKFQTPQVWSSWNYLLVPTSKSQLHNALRITLPTGELMFSTLWPTRTSDCEEFNVTGMLESITYQSFQTILVLGEALDPVEKFTDCGRLQSVASELISSRGRAIAQPVNRWLPTAAARVQTRV
jgi:hypothetical protein